MDERNTDDGRFIHRRRREVDFQSSSPTRAGYTGQAAIETVEDGPWRILFPGQARDVRGIKHGVAAGERVRVVDIKQSDVVPALVEMIVEPVGAAS